jgi:hypothetical protein
VSTLPCPGARAVPARAVLPARRYLPALARRLPSRRLRDPRALLASGKYGLKADTGKFLARCNGCSPGATTPNTVTVHGTDPNTEAYAQWRIIVLLVP